MTRIIWWRPFVLLVGLVAAAIGCFGAWEYALKLEGTVSYLAVAAPVIAGAAALCPVVAHWSWAAGERVRAILWWLLPLPLAAAVVFFSASERVHVAKAGAEAERQALVSAADRARAELARAQADAKSADRAEARFRGAKQCGPQCRSARETAELTRVRVGEAEAKLVKADSKATSEAPLKAPVWLLPAALDVVAFFAIWSGLAGPWRKPEEPKKVGGKSVRPRRKKAKRKVPQAPRLRVVAANTNA